MIGNDVVDMALPEARTRAGSTRFAHRVFTEQELARIAASTCQDLTTWALWSAKEAAFKCAVKCDPTIIFAPRTFQVAGAPTAGGYETALGDVSGPGSWRCRVRWSWNRWSIHCVGVRVPLSITDKGLVAAAVPSDEEAAGGSGFRPLSATERRSARKPQSRRVRRLAKRLLEENGLPGAEVVRPTTTGGFGPPRILDHGRPLVDVGVSLSHDGSWVAAALYIPPARRKSGRLVPGAKTHE